MDIDTYITFTDLLNDAQDRGSDITDNLVLMASHLSSSEISEDNIDSQLLSDAITVAYDKEHVLHYDYTTQMLKVVRLIQKHITDTEGSVDDFLSSAPSNLGMVKSVFALMSSMVGYPIDDLNIEDIS